MTRLRVGMRRNVRGARTGGSRGKREEGSGASQGGGHRFPLPSSLARHSPRRRMPFRHAFLRKWAPRGDRGGGADPVRQSGNAVQVALGHRAREAVRGGARPANEPGRQGGAEPQDRKSTRLNSSHLVNSYAVFCLTRKNTYYSTM